MQDSETKGSGRGGDVSPDEEVEITALSSEGDGVGRLADGRVVFVRDSAPGDRVRLDEIRAARRFVRAGIADLVRPSKDRVAPACPHFGSCGGCQWQHLAYPAQLEAKRQIVHDALERIGGISLPERPEIVPSPEPYAYRARARWVEAEDGLGYRARASREVRKTDSCPVLVPAAEAAMQATAARLQAKRTAQGGRDRSRRAREWVVTAAGPDPDAQAIVSGAHRRGALQTLRIEVAGATLRVDNASFIQGNALLWEPLVAAVREVCLAGPVGETKGRTPRFVELYCGVGFFTIPLAAAGARGVAIESDRSALKHLADNLRRAGLRAQVEILGGRVEAREDLSRLLSSVDFVLVDPPRAGLASRVRDALVDRSPARIVYLSCDPGTLARDLSVLTEGGYSVSSLRLFDLFPQTPHVESLAVLERR
jgi:23S rRNA (uracil1939-C5)-methyltransferase